MIINAFLSQISGDESIRRYVTEVQVDDVEGDLVFEYLAEPGTDIHQIMLDRTAALNAAMEIDNGN
jgi:hypothetical protein